MSSPLPKPPVFVHSLFRSGSTWLFNAFRRSPAGYYCYQEPFHEALLDLAREPHSPEATRSKNRQLRHPDLDQPYFEEFLPLGDELAKMFLKPFAYDLYFMPPDLVAPEVLAYLRLLVSAAPVRAMLQFCRSGGRMRWMARHLEAVHLFLWRNPRDQWLSYKVDSYFDTTVLMIANGPNAPAWLKRLRNAAGVDEFRHAELGHEFEHFRMLRPAGAASYRLFYSIWCQAAMEAAAVCQARISIDRLGGDPDYQLSVAGELERLGVNGLQFGDAAIPGMQYPVAMREMFAEVEQQVHDLLTAEGLDIGPAQALRQELVAQASGEGSGKGDDAAPDRLYAWAASLDSEASRFRREAARLSQIENELHEAQATLQNIYASLTWKVAVALRTTARFLLRIFGLRPNPKRNPKS